MVRRRRVTSIAIVGIATLSFGAGLQFSGGSVTKVATTASNTQKITCGRNLFMCTEVDDSEAAFGEGVYVGHDEPSVMFNSTTTGAGNSMTYGVTLPREPDGPGQWQLGHSYTGQLTPAFWFGMAMCDDQSYPEEVHTPCTADSDSNAPDFTNGHPSPGVAYMELQFYPPGFAQQFADDSCDSTAWCVALTIDSLAEDPINGTTMNSTCASQIGGLEYVNFAYLTTNGVPNGPPNPLQFQFDASGNPKTELGHTFFANQGDNLEVYINDTSAGLSTVVHDYTTGSTGSMVASAANHFGNITYAPTGTSCTENDTAFHPMYATSGPNTRVAWAAGAYNVAMDTEIGHNDPCSQINDSNGTCTGMEGNPQIVYGSASNGSRNAPADQEPAESTSSSGFDDYGCFEATSNTEVSNPYGYCVGSNVPGFDGDPYQHLWPDGSSNKPTPFEFTMPEIYNYSTDTFIGNYSTYQFEDDLARIEASDEGGSCNRTTGAGCTNPPKSDDGTPVNFYPFYSLQSGRAFDSSCEFAAGDGGIPNTFNAFTGNSLEYGTRPTAKTYWVFGGQGATASRYNAYIGALHSGSTNNCNDWF